MHDSQMDIKCFIHQFCVNQPQLHLDVICTGINCLYLGLRIYLYEGRVFMDYVCFPIFIEFIQMFRSKPTLTGFYLNL